MITAISNHINTIKTEVDKMIEERKKANKLTHPRDQAIAYCDKVRAHFDTIRYHVDKLELLVDDESWPLPKYRELLFTK
jgi:glutamine synthetase